MIFFFRFGNPRGGEEILIHNVGDDVTDRVSSKKGGQEAWKEEGKKGRGKPASHFIDFKEAETRGFPVGTFYVVY